jgi:hypothetical protein
VSLASGIGSFTTLLSTVNGVIDTFNNKDATFGEKLLSIFTALGMGIPAVKGVFDSLKDLK